MSRTYKDSKKVTGKGRQRHITVRGIRREQTDLRKLSRALIQLAMAQADAEAQARAQVAETTISDDKAVHGE